LTSRGPGCFCRLPVVPRASAKWTRRDVGRTSGRRSLQTAGGCRSLPISPGQAGCRDAFSWLLLQCSPLLHCAIAENRSPAPPGTYRLLLLFPLVQPPGSGDRYCIPSGDLRSSVRLKHGFTRKSRWPTDFPEAETPAKLLRPTLRLRELMLK